MMRKTALVILFTALAITVSGCELFYILGLPFGTRVPYNPKATVDNITVQRDVQFNDIPVPMAFKLRRNKMFSYKCSSFRLGTFEYEGAWPYRLTKNFYDRQMPMSGWSLLSDQVGDTQALQYWAKGSDRCRVLYDNADSNIKVLMRVYPVGSEPASVVLK